VNYCYKVEIEYTTDKCQENLNLSYQSTKRTITLGAHNSCDRNGSKQNIQYILPPYVKQFEK